MTCPRSEDVGAYVAVAQPRVLVLAAPAGYGKMRVARALARDIGPLRICTVPADGESFPRCVFDALIDGDPARAARFAADRLAERGRSPAAARDTLRREWRSAGADEVLVLRDAANGLMTSSAADLCAELVGTLPSHRRLVIAARNALPPALAAQLPADRTTVFGEDALALAPAAVEHLALRAGLLVAVAAPVFSVARGWPLVTRLIVDQLRFDRDDSIIDAVSVLPAAAMFDFVAHRTVARLAVRVREALIVASFFTSVTYLDLVRLLGPECDDAVFTRMTSLALVERDGERAMVHAELPRILRERFAPLVAPLYERALGVLARAGRHVEAARLALDAGDEVRAAEIIDAAPPFTAAPLPVSEFERIIERLDPKAITRFPNVWVATIPYRSFAIDPAAYIREAETVYFCLPPTSTAELRAAVLMLLGSAYENVGRAGDAAALLDDAFLGFADEEGPVRSSLLNFTASVRGIEGRFADARRLAEEAARGARDSFGQNQTLHYIEAHEAAYRGRHERLTVILDELLQRRSGVEPRLYRTYVAMNGALFAWVAGDDDGFERYQTSFEDGITPAIETALGALIDAARGRPARTTEAHPLPLVVANVALYRMAHAATDEAALAAARTAAQAADVRGEPYLRTLSHVAVYVLDANAREREAATLEAIVEPIESPELRSSVRSVIAGEIAGMLAPFVRRRVLRDSVRAQPRITVELFAGRVTRDGADIRLRDKEFELVALLAAARGSLSRNEIGEALWEHLDTQEWRNNLKVTMYRIRKAVGSREITVTENARHRLAPAVDVDLRRAESLLRASTVPLNETTRAELRGVFELVNGGTLERYEQFAWSNALVARLHDVICSSGITLAADALERRAPGEALEFAARVRGVDPLNENACAIAIRALLATGATDAARREFTRYASALSRELAATPSAALAELVRDVR